MNQAILGVYGCQTSTPTQRLYPWFVQNTQSKAAKSLLQGRLNIEEHGGIGCCPQNSITTAESIVNINSMLCHRPENIMAASRAGADNDH